MCLKQHKHNKPAEQCCIQQDQRSNAVHSHSSLTEANLCTGTSWQLPFPSPPLSASSTCVWERVPDVCRLMMHHSGCVPHVSCTLCKAWSIKASFVAVPALGCPVEWRWDLTRHWLTSLRHWPSEWCWWWITEQTVTVSLDRGLEQLAKGCC